MSDEKSILVSTTSSIFVLSIVVTTFFILIFELIHEQLRIDGMPVLWALGLQGIYLFGISLFYGLMRKDFLSGVLTFTGGGIVAIVIESLFSQAFGTDYLLHVFLFVSGFVFALAVIYFVLVQFRKFRTFRKKAVR